MKGFIKMCNLPAKNITPEDIRGSFNTKLTINFLEIEKSFNDITEEQLLNFLYECYKETFNPAQVYVLSKPDFKRFILEMLPKWLGKKYSGPNYGGSYIEEFEEVNHEEN